MSIIKFQELHLSKELLKAVSDMGFEEATPIQTKSIPEILSGIDVIGQASTGTGKTAAFGLPAIEAIDEEEKSYPNISIEYDNVPHFLRVAILKGVKKASVENDSSLIVSSLTKSNDKVVLFTDNSKVVSLNSRTIFIKLVYNKICFVINRVN